MADKLMSLVQVGNQLVTPDGLVIDKTGFYDVSTRNNNTSDNQNANSTSSSDTGNRIYMIYSDKPVDEIQAAKKIRETERDLSEGF
jgi:hypothetical protein